ncbi:MAG: hypothetical protein AB7Q97_25825 [Gammaproteobacteria bacterium]
MATKRWRRVTRAVACVVFAGMSAGAAAQEPWQGVEPQATQPLTWHQFRDAVRGTAAQMTSIPNGPPIPQVRPEDLARSCEDLYYERVALMQRRNSFGPAYYDDPRNRAIMTVGAMMAPELYYMFGFTAFESYYDRRRVEAVTRRLDGLRQASARQDCFVNR